MARIVTLEAVDDEGALPSEGRLILTSSSAAEKACCIIGNTSAERKTLPSTLLAAATIVSMVSSDSRVISLRSMSPLEQAGEQ